VTYRVVFDGDEHTIYRNGQLFYRTSRKGDYIYQKGEFITVSETMTPEEFLARPDLTRLFTADEKAVIAKGGTFARGLKDEGDPPCGTLHEMKLWEIPPKDNL